MWRALQGLLPRLEPLLDHLAQVAQDAVRLPRLLEIDAHLGPTPGEDGIQRVDGAVPPLWVEIERHLKPEVIAGVLVRCRCGVSPWVSLWGVVVGCRCGLSLGLLTRA